MNEKINNQSFNQIQKYYELEANKRGQQVRSFTQEVSDRNQEIKTTRHSALLSRALGFLMLAGAGYLVSKGDLESAAVFGVGGVGMAGFGELQSGSARKQRKQLNQLRHDFRRGR